MLLLVGLGNPSPENENNRHNIGFKIINAINKKFSLTKQKPKFKGLLTTVPKADTLRPSRCTCALWRPESEPSAPSTQTRLIP